MRKVILSKAAFQQLDDAFEWYEAQQPGLGTRFYNDFLDAAHKIAAHPLLRSRYYQKWHRWNFEIFKHFFLYTYDEENLYIDLVAHSHMARATGNACYNNP